MPALSRQTFLQWFKEYIPQIVSKMTLPYGISDFITVRNAPRAPVLPLSDLRLIVKEPFL
ncbi:hypothetical protein AtDm6_3281 [Acetobacter tropicalis]|uniref:Uncharacterized protein n=1 Tax=Acetobacter tropicalis TaxID=104102 RepID=A0A094ZE65_9PROT|nr:hypothetical protein AtDm6_3281 [Acetobacter tropicalis]